MRAALLYVVLFPFCQAAPHVVPDICKPVHEIAGSSAPVSSAVDTAAMETTETPTETIIATTLIQDEPEKVVSRQEDDVLAIFAAYSGAAYKVTNEWDCEYACQYPGTEGTIIEYNWNIGFPPSAGYIARNPNSKTIITAFQGTEDQSQWLDNLDVALKPWPEAINGSKVHTGFLHGYLDVRDDVVNELKTIASKYLDYSIALVGHSLGGARAALCLLDLSITTPELLPRMYLYTQGQPRTGNKEFANAIDALSVPKYREVYEYDIVPRIPPTFLGYAHHLTEVWIHNNETVLCVNPIDDNSCSGNGDLLHPLSILDHFRYPGLKYEISSN